LSRYFVHHPSTPGVPPIYWRRRQGFGGEDIHTNFNLLAHAVGDVPVAPGGGVLVPTEPYEFAGGRSVDLQPFTYLRLGDHPTRPRALPIGSRLAEFLDDPLGGVPMELSLPFYDEAIKLGPSGGGWFRHNEAPPRDKSFHGATDFDTKPRGEFEVCAAAPGFVLGRSDAADRNGEIVVCHTAKNGAQFLTVYRHMDMLSVPAHVLANPDGAGPARVQRGEYLGKNTLHVDSPHLHFIVAVRRGGFTLNGVDVNSLWYAIDPWGVYDYRNGNYLPTEDNPRIFESEIAGVTRTVHWRNQPVFKTIPIARKTNPYQKIVRLQVRARRAENIQGTLPPEHEQFLVWLKDEADFFLLPLAQATESTTELELLRLLREAFFHSKSVRLEYRYDGDLRYITAAWVND
jgi:hypothetical protein